MISERKYGKSGSDQKLQSQTIPGGGFKITVDPLPLLLGRVGGLCLLLPLTLGWWPLGPALTTGHREVTRPISSPKVDLKRSAAASLVPLRSPCVKGSWDQHAVGRPRALQDSQLSPTGLPDLRVRSKKRAAALNHEAAAQFVKQK